MRAHVEQFGGKNWTQIAAQMSGRSGKQCRERSVAAANTWLSVSSSVIFLRFPSVSRPAVFCLRLCLSVYLSISISAPLSLPLCLPLYLCLCLSVYLSVSAPLPLPLLC